MPNCMVNVILSIFLWTPILWIFYYQMKRKYSWNDELQTVIWCIFWTFITHCNMPWTRWYQEGQFYIWQHRRNKQKEKDIVWSNAYKLDLFPATRVFGFTKTFSFFPFFEVFLNFCRESFFMLSTKAAWRWHYHKTGLFFHRFLLNSRQSKLKKFSKLKVFSPKYRIFTGLHS